MMIAKNPRIDGARLREALPWVGGGSKRVDEPAPVAVCPPCPNPLSGGEEAAFAGFRGDRSPRFHAAPTTMFPYPLGRGKGEGEGRDRHHPADSKPSIHPRFGTGRSAGRSFLASLFTLALAAFQAAAAPAETGSAPDHLPVKEVTVFKDGHAFVVQEGKRPLDARGQVVLPHLPSAVIGTFWAYSADPNLKLNSVVASRRKITLERTALSLREIIEANVGAAAFITEANSNRYQATILGFPARSSEELARTSPPNAEERLPEKGNVVLLRTAEGTKALPIERLQDVTIANPAYKSVSVHEEFRPSLTLGLGSVGGKPAPKSAAVGLMYVQKGIRWIPSYKIDLDGKGNATVKLQATLLNELADLDDVTVNLVIGVPTFAFKETIDPMALEQTAAQLSAYFQTPRPGSRSSLASQFSNAMMTQVARMGDYRQDVESAPAQPVDLPEGTKNEDLFVFTLPKVSLKKGARMMVPVAEYTVPYQDKYVVELPFAPPGEVWRNFNNQQQAELAKLMNAPKAMHKIRLANKSRQPFTTAPALVMREGKVLAQGMMTYASPGASADLSLTVAVDIQVKKTEQETVRTPNALNLNGSKYQKVELSGSLKLTNHRANKIEVEVVRHVLGQVDSATQNGVIRNSNAVESSDFLPAGGDYPHWWEWYSWPWWWTRVNTMGKVTWNVTLEPGKAIDLDYTWHYFWN